MKIIEPLENEPAKAVAEKSDPLENPSNTANDDACTMESEFAPWDD